MKISEFHTTQPTVKFTELGDFVDGTIVDEPAIEPDKYGTGDDKVLVLALLEEDATRRLYARKQMLAAIAQAVDDAGVGEIECADGCASATSTTSLPAAHRR